MPTEVDVAVVGGGPSGGAVAGAIAKQLEDAWADVADRAGAVFGPRLLPVDVRHVENLAGGIEHRRGGVGQIARHLANHLVELHRELLETGFLELRSLLEEVRERGVVERQLPAFLDLDLRGVGEAGVEDTARIDRDQDLGPAGRIGTDLLRDVPLIFLRVEILGIRHVVRRVDRRLNREDVLRVAHVLAQLVSAAERGRWSNVRSAARRGYDTRTSATDVASVLRSLGSSRAAIVSPAPR